MVQVPGTRWCVVPSNVSPGESGFTNLPGLVDLKAEFEDIFRGCRSICLDQLDEDTVAIMFCSCTGWRLGDQVLLEKASCLLQLELGKCPHRDFFHKDFTSLSHRCGVHVSALRRGLLAFRKTPKRQAPEKCMVLGYPRCTITPFSTHQAAPFSRSKGGFGGEKFTPHWTHVAFL